MQNRQVMNAKRYLYKFDQILNEMQEKMLSPQITNSITINFIECMIPHHQAAIYMSENLLEYTRNQRLQQVAKNIIKMQSEGIEQMKEIKNSTYGFSNLPQEVKCYMEKYFEITKSMLEKMRNAPRCISINLNFINEMISHHEGALAMCDNLLQYYIAPHLKLMAESIISEQSKGIKELREIQQRLCR